MEDNLDERMKLYEDIEAKRILIPKLPTCIRIDGRGFSKYTKGMNHSLCEFGESSPINSYTYRKFWN